MGKLLSLFRKWKDAKAGKDRANATPLSSIEDSFDAELSHESILADPKKPPPPVTTFSGKADRLDPMNQMTRLTEAYAAITDSDNGESIQGWMQTALKSLAELERASAGQYPYLPKADENLAKHANQLWTLLENARKHRRYPEALATWELLFRLRSKDVRRETAKLAYDVARQYAAGNLAAQPQVTQWVFGIVADVMATIPSALPEKVVASFETVFLSLRIDWAEPLDRGELAERLRLLEQIVPMISTNSKAMSRARWESLCEQLAFSRTMGRWRSGDLQGACKDAQALIHAPHVAPDHKTLYRWCKSRLMIEVASRDEREEMLQEELVEWRAAGIELDQQNAARSLLRYFTALTIAERVLARRERTVNRPAAEIQTVMNIISELPSIVGQSYSLLQHVSPIVVAGERLAG